MIVRWDYTKPWAYVPTLFGCLWIGVAVVSFILAESNLLATMILHLNGRYLMLQKEIREISNNLLAKTHPSQLAIEFRKEIIKMVDRNMELNDFATKLENAFTFRVFIMMAMSAILLCVLGFKVATVSFIFTLSKKSTLISI